MNEEQSFTDEVTHTAIAAQEVGKAVGNPLYILLGPSAKVLGEHWANKLQSKISSKEKQNLEHHIAEANAILPSPEAMEITPTKIGALLEWTNSAKRVSFAEESKVSYAWQLALADLLKDDFDLLSALPDMDEETLTAFLDRHKLNRDCALKLKRMGLIHNETNREINFALTGFFHFS